MVKIIRWNDEDKKILMECVEKKLSWEEIAKILHRSKYSVLGKSRIMGLVKNRRSSKVGAYTKLENIDTIQICLNCPKIECDNCLEKFT